MGLRHQAFETTLERCEPCARPHRLVGRYEYDPVQIYFGGASGGARHDGTGEIGPVYRLQVTCPTTTIIVRVPADDGVTIH